MTTHKFAKDSRVMIVPLGERGRVLHAFVYRVYAQPDVPRYTVQTDKGATYECDESELAT